MVSCSWPWCKNPVELELDTEGEYVVYKPYCEAHLYLIFEKESEIPPGVFLG